MASKAEQVLDILERIDSLIQSGSEDDELRIDDYMSYLYDPRPELANLLEPIKEFVQKKHDIAEEYDGTELEDEESEEELEEEISVVEEDDHKEEFKLVGNGKYLEELALVTFLGLKGISNVLGYHSAIGEHDLILSGNGFIWKALKECLYMPVGRDEILVEAKSTDEPTPFRDFARLCCVIQEHSRNTGLGIIFSLNGAKNLNRSWMKKKRKSPTGAWLCQLLYYAKYSIPVIVFDAENMLQMDEPGALPRIIRQKVREISNMTGKWEEVGAREFEQVDLPKHMKKYVSDVLND